MATFSQFYAGGRQEHFSLFHPDRPDALGAAVSAALPVALLIALNSLAVSSGWTVAVPHYQGLPFAPPSWLSTAIWIAMFPMWGLACWMVRQTGAQGRIASRWLMALIGWSLVLPLVSPGFDLLGMTFANVLTLLLAIGTAARVFAASRRAFLLVLPSVLWLGFATFLGFAAIAQGWSPGFAATQQGAQA